MKKFLLVAMALVLAMSSAVMAAPPDNVTLNVEAMVWSGILPGDSEIIRGHGLDDEINRVQYTALLCYVLMEMSPTYEEDTADIDYEQDAFLDTYYYSVDDLFYLGILEDTANHKFYPDERILRQDAAVFMDKAVKYLGIETKPKPVQFSDAADISKEAKDAVGHVAGLRLMGTVDGKSAFGPNETYTIGQAIHDVFNIVLCMGAENPPAAGLKYTDEELEAFLASNAPEAQKRTRAALYEYVKGE